MAAIVLATTWVGNATVQYDAANLIVGVEYTPVVQMSLEGKDYQGWENPIHLQIKTPESPTVLSNTVSCTAIPLRTFNDFSFPSFTLTTPVDSNKMITLTAKTKQEAKLNSMLLFSNTIMMDEGKPTGPLSICWSLQVSAEYDAAALTPGSKYAFAFRLMLKGESTEGWEEAVTLKVVLPDGQEYPTTTVDPNDIPLNSYQNFQSGVFVVTKSQGKITLNVITEQGRNLKSALDVENILLVPQ